MDQSFEELIGQELDRLYRAALFLTGGGKARAERVLTHAVLAARADYEGSHAESGSPGIVLDRHLVRAFIGRGHLHPELPGPGPDPASFQPAKTGTVPQTLTLGALAQAAEGLPPAHRVAFWLSLLERRRYAEIGEILGVPREQVARWVREAYGYVRDAMSPRQGRHHSKPWREQ